MYLVVYVLGTILIKCLHYIKLTFGGCAKLKFHNFLCIHSIRDKLMNVQIILYKCVANVIMRFKNNSYLVI